jgi:D-alanyl-D-alanine carboxypeptidase/D-alanyl-D-alanine-endopeptidase (penicillin-binding protein 4)
LSPQRRNTARLLHVATAAFVLGWAAAGAAADEGALARALERIVSGEHLRHADVGIHVVAVASGRVIYGRNAMGRFVAASNEKLVTAAAALDALGEQYEFETALQAGGALEGGTLRGDLILRGGGDPTLGGRHDPEPAEAIFRRWAHVLKDKGLRRIEGDVLADDTFFDSVYRHPNWDRYPAWKWYYTTTSAVSINDNCVTITVKPGGAPGRPARVTMRPASAPLQLKNVCKTSRKKHAIWFDREEGSRVITVGGRIKQGSAGYSHEVAVPEPALHAAAALKEALEAEGVEVSGRSRALARGAGGRARRGEALLVRRSALVPVLRTMLRQSHNHYAEQVVKTIGAETSGVGSWPAGLARAARMLNEMGFGSDEFNLDDGSGLSRENVLTPALLTTVLMRMRRSEHGATFVSLLAVASRDGTLKRRLTEAPYAGNVRAKSGYLSGVGALSGLAQTRSGIEVAFSILVNDTHNPPGTYSMRQTVDGICRAIVDLAE